MPQGLGVFFYSVAPDNPLWYNNASLINPIKEE